MAKDTKKEMRNLVMYSVYVRNHSHEGTFDALISDLDRIKALGVDIIWLLPIHPIGKKARKGELGSPYAISDYRAVNPEYGTLDDFIRLVENIHERHMKCVIDVVYNHTAPDSWLAHNHPEWFYHKADGNFGNRIGEWSDIIDLDYTRPGLRDYQIETLQYWAKIVDGFRCDVAPLIPLDFWLRARRDVSAVNPQCLWLSESVEPVFILDNRERGMISHSDSEIFQAFDICYDYDIFHDFRAYLKDHSLLPDYVQKINTQEYIYPDNYVKLRYLENHDQERAKSILPDENILRNWTAFTYFQKGMTLLYAGQEMECTRRPDLFDKDTIDWDTGFDLSPLLTKLYAIKKDALFTHSRYEVRLINDTLLASHRADGRQITGVFSATGKPAAIFSEIENGRYKNLINDRDFFVNDNILPCDGTPMIFTHRTRQ